MEARKYKCVKLKNVHTKEFVSDFFKTKESLEKHFKRLESTNKKVIINEIDVKEIFSPKIK